MDDLKAMSNTDLLAQINGHDPYDVEFARRFRHLEARIAAADALAAAVWEFNSGKHYTFGTVLKATDAYTATKEGGA